MKRILSLALMLCMLAAMLPVTADAAAAGTLMSNAVELDFDQTYYKAWTKGSDHLNHYMTFTLTERGIVTVKADKPYDDEGEYTRLNITIFDENGDPIMGNESFHAVDSAKSFYTVKFGLDAGTYYMSFLPKFYVVSGVIGINYSISFEANQYCEVEPNGDAPEATELKFGKMYTGYFGGDGSDYEEHDYFKFQKTAGHTYRIRMNNYGDFAETSAMVKIIGATVAGSNSDSVYYYLEKNIDEYGMHYCDVTASDSGMCYLYIYNFSGAQFEYGFEVTDLTAGEEPEEPTEPDVHEHSYTSKVTNPTCTEKGYTTYTCACGESYVDNYVKAKGHNYDDGICTRCGEDDPNYVDPAEPKPTEPAQPDEPETINITRLAGSHRYETAFLAADQLKVELGIEKFDAVVVASGTSFADALSGSYLAAVKNAPILLASGVEKVDVLVKDYIKSNLRTGGTVYILGGTSAVPASFEEGLGAFTIDRLAGANRFDTNLMVLEEAGIGDKPVLVCTGLSFADSLSASAAERPILLVWNKLTDDQKAIVEALAQNGNDFYIIGGESAVSTDMYNQIAAYGVSMERVAGNNRFETSVAIAEKFFDAPDSAVLAYAGNFPDGLCGGALAAAMDAPLILTMDKFEAKAAEYVQANGVKNGVILGGEGLISLNTVLNVFQ